jgi:DNA polymerase III delta subunit
MSSSFPKITITAGDNQFEIRIAKNKFVETVNNLFPNHTDEYFDATEETEFKEFIQKIMTPSMFGDIKVLFINHAENKNVLAAKRNLEAFESAMNLCADEVFVFVEINENSNEKTPKDCLSPKDLSNELKRIAQNIGGNFTEFKAIKEYEIPKWIKTKVSEYYNRQISEDCAALLVKFSGADLGILDGELRKIDAALPAKKEISQDDILELTGNNRLTSAEEIAHFLGLRKWDMEAMNSFENYSSKENLFAVPFLSELFRHFWILLKIRLFADENRSKANVFFRSNSNYDKNTAAFEIVNACGILKETQKNAIFPMVIKPKLIEQASLYNKNDLFEIINMITQHDRDIKNGVIKSDSHKTTIMELCRKIVRTGK